MVRTTLNFTHALYHLTRHSRLSGTSSDPQKNPGNACGDRQYVAGFSLSVFYDAGTCARAFNPWCLDILLVAGVVDTCTLVSVAGKTYFKFAGAATGPNAVEDSRGFARDCWRAAWRL